MSAEKIEVCEQQLAIVREICGIYDNEPDEKEQVKQVTVLMEKVQMHRSALARCSRPHVDASSRADASGPDEANVPGRAIR